MPISGSTLTAASLCAQLIDIYDGLLESSAKEEITSLPVDAPLRERIEFLDSVVTGHAHLHNGNAAQFLNAMLDVHGIALATDGTVDGSGAALGNALLLGVKRDRRGILLSGADGGWFHDWHFSALMQAHFRREGIPAKDLKKDPRMKGKGQVCDFEIPKDDGTCELIECTRLSGNTGIPRERLLQKIITKMQEKALQLANTATHIGKTASCKTLAIDLSIYNEPVTTVTKSGRQMTVMQSSEEDREWIIAHLPPVAGIDALQLCTRSLMTIDGYPSAIEHSSLVLTGSPHVNPSAYKGWSIEAYPLGNGRYGEIHTSITARNSGWITTSFNNIFSPETFFTIGAEESLHEST